MNILMGVSFVDSLKDRFAAELVQIISDIYNLLSEWLLSIPIDFLMSPAFEEVYMLIVRMAILLSAIPTLVLGFKVLTGRCNNKQAVNTLKKLLLLPIFSIASPLLIRLFASKAEKISRVINEGVNLIQLSEGVSLAAFGITSLVLSVIFVFKLISLLLYFAQRNFKLLMLIIFAPLLYLFWSMPEHKGQMKRWESEVVLLFSTLIAHSIELLVLYYITIGVGLSNIESRSQFVSVLLTQVGALIFMDKTPQWLSKYIANTGYEGYLLKKRSKDVWNILKRIAGKVK